MGAVIATASGTADARCVNLSRSGALLAAKLQLKVGDRLTVQFDDAEVPIAAVAEVVRVTPTGIAVRFVELEAELEQLLRHVLDERLATAKARRPRRAEPIPAFT